MAGTIWVTDDEADALRAVIASRSGFGTSAELERVLEKLDELPERPVPKLEERLAKAGKLLADGMPVTTVAKMAHMSYRMLRRHFPDARPWTSKEAGEYGVIVRQLDRI